MSEEPKDYDDQIIVLDLVTMPAEPHPLAELVYTRLKDWVVNLGEIPWDNVPPFGELDAEERETLNRCGKRLESLIAEKYQKEVQPIIPPELNQLWAVIGEAGCRLDMLTRAGMIAGLTHHATYGISSLYNSLPRGLSLDNLGGDPYLELSEIELEPADCWQAIAQIATAMSEEERGER